MLLPLLQPEEHSFIRAEIDRTLSLPNKFFITMTWHPDWIEQMSEKINTEPQAKIRAEASKMPPLEAWKINQFHHYFIRLAKRTNSHLQAYGGLNPEWEHHHFHAILLSELPMELSTIRTTWDYCIPTAKHAQRYNPERNAVGYIFGRHYGIRNEGRVYCPGVKKSCRNGNCKFEEGSILKRSA